MDTKAQDALVIIELYKLRCEPLMRTARAWFVSEFAPQSGRQIVELLLSGQEHRKEAGKPAESFEVLGASQSRWKSVGSEQQGIGSQCVYSANCSCSPNLPARPLRYLSMKVV